MGKHMEEQRVSSQSEFQLVYRNILDDHPLGECF